MNKYQEALEKGKQSVIDLLDGWEIAHTCGLIDLIKQTKLLCSDDPVLAEAIKSVKELANILSWDIRAVCPNKRLQNEIFDFIGYTQYKNIVIFKRESVEHIENKESLRWLIIHELTHIYITRYSSLIRDIEQVAVSEMSNRLHIKTWQEIQENDYLHESLPEESFANAIATAIVGNNYDRKWWRKQKEMFEE